MHLQREAGVGVGEPGVSSALGGGGEGGRTGRFFSSFFLSSFLQELGGPQRLRIFQPLQDKLGLPKAVTSFHNTELPLPV